VFLKLAIEAKLSAVAGVVIALGGDHSVEAAFAAVVGDIGVLDAVVFVLGSAEAGLHVVVFGQFALAI
jgi:hypothetical protein